VIPSEVLIASGDVVIVSTVVRRILLKVRATGLDIARARAKALRPNGLRAGEVVAARGGDRRVVAVGSQVWLPMVATLLWVVRRCVSMHERNRL